MTAKRSGISLAAIIIHPSNFQKLTRMIDFIKENISWLKDLFTLLFVGTGTVVAILTYRRARATILQPIRTEVIKKQSEILSSVMSTVI